MIRLSNLTTLSTFVFFAVAPLHAQIGKTIIIPAGSDMDHQLAEINAATDPAQKLKLLDAFAATHSEPDAQILVDEQYVNYYINAKQYDKAFQYGDKLFALDPDNFSNAVNMVRAANEAGDTNRLFAAGEKDSGILQRFKTQAAPAGTSPDAWKAQQEQKLEAIKDNQAYIEQSLMSAAFQQKDAAAKAGLLVRFGNFFP